MGQHWLRDWLPLKAAFCMMKATSVWNPGAGLEPAWKIPFEGRALTVGRAEACVPF